MLRRAVRPRMTEPTLQQAKVAHRSGNLKRALQLSEEGLAQPGSEFSLADRHELWVVKSHCLSALPWGDGSKLYVRSNLPIMKVTSISRPMHGLQCIRAT